MLSFQLTKFYIFLTQDNRQQNVKVDQWECNFSIKGQGLSRFKPSRYSFLSIISVYYLIALFCLYFCRISGNAIVFIFYYWVSALRGPKFSQYEAWLSMLYIRHWVKSFFINLIIFLLELNDTFTYLCYHKYGILELFIMFLLEEFLYYKYFFSWLNYKIF